jgi:hypothetical protein
MTEHEDNPSCITVLELLLQSPTGWGLLNRPITSLFGDPGIHWVGFL